MTDRAAFIAAVKANPPDDAPRLVYADWLDEKAGGQDKRAELIRVQIELAKLNDPVAWEECKHAGRECKNPACPLVAQHARYKEVRKLERDLADLFKSEDASVTLTWVRGFVEAFTGSAEKWFEYSEPLIAFHPVREVRLTTIPDNFRVWYEGSSRFVSVEWGGCVEQQGGFHTDRDILDFVSKSYGHRWPGTTFHIPEPAIWDSPLVAMPIDDLRSLTERLRQFSSPITAAGTVGTSTAPTG